MRDSNTYFITAPDNVDTDHHKVVLIDVSTTDVQLIALWCSESDTQFDVYLFCENDTDFDWLNKAIGNADAIIVNGEPSNISKLKQNIADNTKTHKYGFADGNTLTQPLDYFRSNFGDN